MAKFSPKLTFPPRRPERSCGGLRPLSRQAFRVLTCGFTGNHLIATSNPRAQIDLAIDRRRIERSRRLTSRRIELLEFLKKRTKFLNPRIRTLASVVHILRVYVYAPSRPLFHSMRQTMPLATVQLG